MQRLTLTNDKHSNGRPATALGISNSDYNTRPHTAFRRPCTALPNNTSKCSSLNFNKKKLKRQYVLIYCRMICR